MANYFFGSNLIENLTTGMYTNSLVIFREYIQNSCDAIDKARADFLAADEDKIEITIDRDARRITIEDNGTGISVLDFKATLTSIAASDKSLVNDRGFRGIGRLCGVAYCRELSFTSTARGENIQSKMTVDAEKLRSNFYGKEKIKASDALDESITFSTTAYDEPDEHFFRVELIDIVDTNEDLLDVEKVREYLSFVAPVDYSTQLYYQTQIYEHAKSLNFKIAKYKILVNGEEVVKNYKTNFKTTHNGSDEIFGVEFHDFFDAENNLIAWSWIGLSKFKGVIDQTSGTPDNLMRGIRLRAGNIQIGDAEALKHLFNEARGTNYFIGEVHAVDKNLIPNGRRDYFVENESCKVFEEKLREYFKKLYEIYHIASDIRGLRKKIDAPAEVERDFNDGVSLFKTRAELNTELTRLKKIAASAEKKISSMRQEAEEDKESPRSRVVLRMTDDKVNPPPVNLYRRLRKQNLSPCRAGRETNENSTARLKISSSAIRNSPAKLSFARFKRSSPNEPPRFACGAELEKQISAREFDEARHLLPRNLQGRRAILQGRHENFWRAAVARRIFCRQRRPRKSFCTRRERCRSKILAARKTSAGVREERKNFSARLPARGRFFLRVRAEKTSSTVQERRLPDVRHNLRQLSVHVLF